MATRWRWPPDNWAGRRSSKASICRFLATRATTALRSALGILRISSANSMFWRTVMLG